MAQSHLAPDAFERWHAQPVAQVLEALATTSAGLSEDEARRRCARDGPNELPVPPPRSLGRRLLAQVADPMVLLLLAAAGLALLLNEIVDAAVIGAIVVLNAAIGAGQEGSAERALRALRRLGAPTAVVVRDGRPAARPAREIVAGDVLEIEAGANVPADLRLLGSASLRVDESALTGESVPVDKLWSLSVEAQAPLGDRTNMVHRGTLVTHGRGTGVVVATGTATEVGRISAVLAHTEEPLTPLQRRLAELSRRLAFLAVGLCGVMFAVGVARGEPPFPMLLTAVSLAVAAIPEALPAVMTLGLATGAQRMARHNALVRRLPAVEALGSVTVIGSDKTGTLTQNRMEARLFHRAGETAEVPGRDPGWRDLLTGAALCSDVEEDGSTLLGDPTEVALADAARAAGFDLEALRRESPRVAEVPFDAARRMMTTLHERSDGSWVSYTKGAAESVLARATSVAGVPGPAGEALRSARQAAEEMAARGYRVLAVSHRQGLGPPPAEVAALERELTLLGLVGLFDPLRPEAAEAIALCRRAGIRPILITGDHPLTARAVARQLGLPDEAEDVLTGVEVDRLDDHALAGRADRVSVYARVAPEQKLRIVMALQARGHVVAMTGDGVNDAPALRRAEIGVAMGRSGTDAAREAADMVLLDDHFATIVHAVAEGRRIYANARRFVRYIVATNAAEVLTLFAAPLLGFPLPLLPAQILWINLMTDSAPALALAFEPASPHVMQRPPRPASEGLFARGLGWRVAWAAVFMAAVCLAVFAGGLARGLRAAPTMVFSVLCLSQLANAMAVRSESLPVWKLGFGSNRPLLAAVAGVAVLQAAVVYAPPLQRVFDTVALSPAEALVVLGASFLVYAAIEAGKLFELRWASRND
jgi:Ca2+-transporting ATPase